MAHRVRATLFMYTKKMAKARVRIGLSRLMDGDGPKLSGQRVSLLCHPASQTETFVHAADVIVQHCQAKLCSLLGPEHGVDATAQDMIAVEEEAKIHPRYRVPVYSLYGDDEDSLAPTNAAFHDADWVVIDLQDVGARYYTYVWTAVMTAEVALAHGRKVLLLDRPNPLGGEDDQVEGGAVESGFASFVGYHNVAVRHGLTLAEVVTMALRERRECSLEGLLTLACEGWSRREMFQDTGLPWVMPSPNMPSLTTAVVYPGQCLFEGTLMSEGRGTTRPFELFGAPWVDGHAWLASLDRRYFEGLALRPVAFEPTFQKHARLTCAGLALHVQDAHRVQSLAASFELLRSAYAQSQQRCQGPAPGQLPAPGPEGHTQARTQFAWRSEVYEFVSKVPAIDVLAGGSWLREQIEAGEPVSSMMSYLAPQREAFLERRREYLIYPTSTTRTSVVVARGVDLDLAGTQDRHGVAK